MKKLRTFVLAVAALFALAHPSFAQWQVPDHSVPIGRGSGYIGFKNLPPGPLGYIITSNGPGSDPSYQPNANVGTVTSITLQGGVNGSPNPITGAGTITADANYFGFATSNCTLSASVGSNTLTVALKTNAGVDPTAAQPCNINYRNTPTSAGGTTAVSQTSALSISTFAAGASLGSSNGSPFRLWVVVFNNAGTNVLALINCSTATSVLPLNESATASSTAMSAAATAAGTFYTPNGTTVAAKAFRILGYVEYGSGLATAGTYVSLPTTLQVFGPGIKKPGDVVQMVSATSGTAAATASSYVPSATLPTTAAGALAVSAPAFTGTSTANLVRLRGVATGSGTSTNNIITGYLASGTTVLAAGAGSSGAGNTLVSVPLFYSTLVPSSGGNPTATTYSLYVAASVGTVSSNAINGLTAALWTGIAASNIMVEEIMG